MYPSGHREMDRAAVWYVTAGLSWCTQKYVFKWFRHVKTETSKYYWYEEVSCNVCNIWVDVADCKFFWFIKLDEMCQCTRPILLSVRSPRVTYRQRYTKLESVPTHRNYAISASNNDCFIIVLRNSAMRDGRSGVPRQSRGHCGPWETITSAVTMLALPRTVRSFRTNPLWEEWHRRHTAHLSL